ncbi:MAG: GtrA family protein [Salinirussus sp.]
MTDGTRGGDRIAALVSGRRFGRFASVGVLGALLDITVLVVLAEGLGIRPEVATLAGIESAILLMFVINDRWTYADEGSADRWAIIRRLGRSHAVRAVGSLTQFVAFIVLFRTVTLELAVGGLDLWLIGAKLAAIGIAVVVNYTFETLFTWRVHRE